MTDINPDTADKPIEIPSTPTGDQAATLGRDVLILVSALPALLAVFGTHDINQIVAYIGSSAFAPALGVIVLVATAGWRQWKARKRHSNDVKMATPLPDTIAKIV